MGRPVRKISVKFWTGFNWREMGYIDLFCKLDDEISSSIKVNNFYTITTDFYSKLFYEIRNFGGLNLSG
jgi:hypothetical protein